MPLDARTNHGNQPMHFAASCGQLEMVQWLRAEGCPWDAGTRSAAVYRGQVEVLQNAVAGAKQNMRVH